LHHYSVLFQNEYQKAILEFFNQAIIDEVPRI
jgi:hypothetical protein